MLHTKILAKTDFFFDSETFASYKTIGIDGINQTTQATINQITNDEMCIS
ncbi:hypothetical protein [Clostridium sp. ZBS13]|nr:hypothetical protein [Clostridium sp. ZBS13]